MSIVDLHKRVSRLSKEKKDLFNRFFTTDYSVGKLEIPKKMQPWVKKQFGSVAKVKKQHIVRVENNFTRESTLFNEVRALRPMVKSKSNAKEEIEKSKGGPFCNPTHFTPADVFGRIRGKHGLTGSNIAKYDKWHGLVMFKEHNPLKFTKASVHNNLETAKKWIKKSHKEDKSAKYPYILWQCLWKSGSSVIHGHMQLMLPRKFHYSNVSLLNEISQKYYSDCGYDYFDDLFYIHQALGLALEKGRIKIIVSLTPKKEKEIMIIAPNLSKKFSNVLYDVLACLRDDMGVESFTLGIALPPLKYEKEWEGFPVVARVIDRGSLSVKATDIGAMEFLAGASVVATDPYKVIKKLRKRM